MSDWMSLLAGIAEEIQRETKRIYGHPESSEEVWLEEVRGGRARMDAVGARILLRRLKDSGKNCTLVSEECGEMRFGRDPTDYLIVDEVDGTTNATRGIPFYATSLAVADGPQLSSARLGVVMNLATGDLYTAQRGEGARKNGSPIHCSEARNIIESLLVVDTAPTPEPILKKLNTLFEKCKHVRHYGAAALEICLLAEGRLDAFIDLRDRLRVTDVAAGLVALREAGGMAVDLQGGELDAPLKHNQKVSFIAAGNATLLKSLRKTVQLSP